MSDGSQPGLIRRHARLHDMRNAASIVVFPRTEYAAEPMDAGDCVRFERRDLEWIMADFMAGGVW